jgi:ATP-binding cassette subfamily C (CFTR/MRP) protein 4
VSHKEFEVREEEDRAVGTVSWSIYWQYFRAGGNVFVLLFLLIMCVLTQASYNVGDWWLSVW